MSWKAAVGKAIGRAMIHYFKGLTRWYTSPLAATLAGLILIISNACTPLPTPSLFDAQVLDSTGTAVDAPALPGDATADTVTAQQQTGISMTGTWVLATDWSSCVVLGDAMEQRAHTLTRVTMIQEGRHLHEKRQICFLQSTPVLGQTTIFPQAALDSVGVIAVESSILGADTHLSYAGGMEVQLWGLQLTDPLAESMPSSATDPRIIDADHDGLPGVTFHLGKACDMQVVQRSLAVVDAQLGIDGKFSGGAVRSNEMYVVAGSNGLCTSTFAVHANDAANHATMVRVDAKGLNLDTDGNGEVDCAEVVAAKDQIVQFLDADDARCTN